MDKKYGLGSWAADPDTQVRLAQSIESTFSAVVPPHARSAMTISRDFRKQSFTFPSDMLEGATFSEVERVGRKCSMCEGGPQCKKTDEDRPKSFWGSLLEKAPSFSPTDHCLPHRWQASHEIFRRYYVGEMDSIHQQKMKQFIDMDDASLSIYVEQEHARKEQQQQQQQQQPPPAPHLPPHLHPGAGPRYPSLIPYPPMRGSPPPMAMPMAMPMGPSPPSPASRTRAPVVGPHPLAATNQPSGPYSVWQGQPLLQRNSVPVVAQYREAVQWRPPRTAENMEMIRELNRPAKEEEDEQRVYKREEVLLDSDFNESQHDQVQRARRARVQCDRVQGGEHACESQGCHFSKYAERGGRRGACLTTEEVHKSMPDLQTQPKAFQMWVNDVLVGSQTTSRRVGQHEVCPQRGGVHELSPYQKFAGDYVSQTHKSLLAYWCTGSGKTALAISIMHSFLPQLENVENFFNIFFIYPTGTDLANNCRKEVDKFFSGEEAERLKGFIEEYNYSSNSMGQDNRIFFIKQGQSGDVLKRRLAKSKEYRRKLGHTNCEPDTPMNGNVFIVDEAHNLLKTDSSDNANRMENVQNFMTNIQRAHATYNDADEVPPAILVLLTATPLLREVAPYAYQVSKLLNLLNPTRPFVNVDIGSAQERSQIEQFLRTYGLREEEVGKGEDARQVVKLANEKQFHRNFCMNLVGHVLYVDPRDTLLYPTARYAIDRVPTPAGGYQADLHDHYGSSIEDGVRKKWGNRKLTAPNEFNLFRLSSGEDKHAVYKPTHDLKHFKQALDEVSGRGMSTEEILSHLEPYFPKGVRLARRITRKDNNGVFLVYSGAMQSPSSPTFHALKLLLELLGFRDFVAKCGGVVRSRQSGKSYPVVDSESCDPAKGLDLSEHALDDKYEYKRMLNLWNTTELYDDNSMHVDVVDQLFNKITDKQGGSGKFIKVIMINDASIEGISFLNTVHLEILNPPYVPRKLKQLLGRIRRMRGMCGVASPQNRVAMYRFYVTYRPPSTSNTLLQGGAPGTSTVPRGKLELLEELPTLGRGNELEYMPGTTTGDRGNDDALWRQYATLDRPRAVEDPPYGADRPRAVEDPPYGADRPRDWSRARSTLSDPARVAEHVSGSGLSSWYNERQFQDLLRKEERQKVRGEQQFLQQLYFDPSLNFADLLMQALRMYSVDCRANQQLHPNNKCWFQ